MSNYNWLVGDIFLYLLTTIMPLESHYKTDTDLFEQYLYYCEKPSDIQSHIPTLKNLGTQCISVAEIGLRDMISTWGILQGLAENPADNKFYIGVDLAMPPYKSLSLAKRLSSDHDIKFTFLLKNDMEINLPIIDMLFIDSLHTYAHLTYELEKFSPQVQKFIALHDTSSPWGEQDDTEYHGDRSEYPSFINKNKRGLWPAVEDFLKNHPEWELYQKSFNDHGFTILKRKY